MEVAIFVFLFLDLLMAISTFVSKVSNLAHSQICRYVS